MDDPETKEQNMALAQTNIKRLLQGDTPRVIYEWELASELWDAARFEIDHRNAHNGQFIFTGSAAKIDTDKMELFQFKSPNKNHPEVVSLSGSFVSRLF